MERLDEVVIDEDKSLPARRWRFFDFFRRPSEAEKREVASSKLQAKLKHTYPENTGEILDFLAKTLRRRQRIVERLSMHPELNSHGFFMVICKVYRDTYHGMGLTNERLAQLIQVFSTPEISRTTAARILQKANEAEVFVSESDAKDKRRQRYYLHPDMISICSDVFGGMLSDARGGAA